jgi:hypothetical protein
LRRNLPAVALLLMVLVGCTKPGFIGRASGYWPGGTVDRSTQVTHGSDGKPFKYN